VLQIQQVLCNITKVCINGTTLVFNALITSERTKRLLRRLSVTACKHIFLWTKRSFTSTHRSALRMTECGLLAENVMSLQVGC